MPPRVKIEGEGGPKKKSKEDVPSKEKKPVAKSAKPETKKNEEGPYQFKYVEALPPQLGIVREEVVRKVSDLIEKNLDTKNRIKHKVSDTDDVRMIVNYILRQGGTDFQGNFEVMGKKSDFMDKLASAIYDAVEGRYLKNDTVDIKHLNASFQVYGQESVGVDKDMREQKLGSVSRDVVKES